MDQPLSSGPPITFDQLLHNLKYVCDCTVVKLSEAGIPDADGTLSGDFYEVTRSIPRLVLYAHIEVYDYTDYVLPERLEDICATLGLPQFRVRGMPN